MLVLLARRRRISSLLGFLLENSPFEFSLAMLVVPTYIAEIGSDPRSGIPDYYDLGHLGVSVPMTLPRLEN